MVEPPDTIIEEREEFMVSPTGDGKPTKRTAHFLKPSLTSIDGPVLELPSHVIPSLATSSDPIKWPLKVLFNGWRNPPEDWKTWLDRMHSLHQATWKRAGIYEAIMGSWYNIRRNDDLVFGIAERWCSETNSFIFPWGEAAITLEDMIVLGGYSVLGDSVSIPLETRELKETEEKLIEVRQQISRTKHQRASQPLWIRHFMDNESECEHEAFLSLWLSRFVFPKVSFNTIVKHVFPIAIHLARGKQIALAPAVLARIYRDLSLLKEAIVASSNLKTAQNKDDFLALTLWAPLQLVQVWAWERFVTLRPNPNLIEYGEPRLARWHKPTKLKLENVRLALDSAGECFQWRPYTTAVYNWLFPKFYGENKKWVLIDPDLDRDLVSFARCLRVCELVGIDCMEQYLPHRVSMQFGMDQDIPGHVDRYNETPEIAWRSYSMPIINAKLYIPPRLFESDVTARYLAWWKQSFLGQQNLIKGVVRKRRSSKRSKKLPQSSKDKKGDNDASVPPGFPPKSIRVEGGDSIEEDKLTILEVLKSSKKHNSVGNKLGGDVLPLLSTESQSLSFSTADDGTNRKMEPSMGGLERVMEEKNESKERSLVNKKVSINSYEGVTNSSSTFEVPGLELEARISKLEKVIAELKEKLGYGLEEKTSKGPSGP